MIIRNDTIFFKSGYHFFKKERNGKKLNTVRFFDDPDEEKNMVAFYQNWLQNESKFIEITNVQNSLQSFKRKIVDISRFRVPGQWCWIITWEPVHDVPCKDIEKCKWIVAAAEIP